ncbi:MAG: hypothetical protein HFE86_07275 [Clostridiales bacterium]|nr:hypothetical protein [Clostridiales bacterium]
MRTSLGEGKVLLFLQRRRRLLLALLIFAAGFALRAYQFGRLPGGLNQDEASVGYDAWAILHTGIDRNGVRLPVHLIAWGSGQNALYAYLSMPFIALMGLNVYSVRMVNFLMGLLAIPLVFRILDRTAGRRPAFIGMALMAAVPWGIMASRWGLESNLFPTLFLLTFAVLLRGVDRPRLLPVFAALAALNLYAYGAAYLFIPVFCLAALVYIRRSAGTAWRYILISGGIFIAVALPVLLFVLTNLFHWGHISILGFTAPELPGVTRISTATASHSLLDSLGSFYKSVILQTDSTVENCVEGYGVLFPISLPFTFAGCAALFRMRRRDGRLFRLLSAWVFSGLLLFLFYAWTNVNRVNILYPALLMLTALGIDWLCGSRRRLGAVGACYLLLSAGFTSAYFGGYRQQADPAFFSTLGDAITLADERAADGQTVSVTPHINHPYIYALFYLKIPPDLYWKTCVIPDPDVQFQQVESFGRFVFNTDGLEEGRPGIYVLWNEEAAAYRKAGRLLGVFAYFSVLEIE